MRTIQLLLVINEMLKKNPNSVTRAINFVIWNCQKKNILMDYCFLPIHDGPLSTDILCDFWFLVEIANSIVINGDNIKITDDLENHKLIAKYCSYYSKEIDIIHDVIENMDELNLIDDDSQITDYWKKELEAINIKCE